ncbi:MAG: hypothetical protein WA185_15405, partial [Candidatus Acidiferrales bacterium]
MMKMRKVAIGGVLAVAAALTPPMAKAQRAIGAPRFSGRIYMTPVPGVPFSAVEEVQITSALANGDTFERKSFSLLARDSRGRIHNETRGNVPMDSTRQPQVLSMMVYDPDSRTSVFMDPYTHIARQVHLNYPPGTAPPYNWAQRQQPQGGAPADPNVRYQDLGTSTMEGVDVHGYRREVTLSQKVSGTEQPIVVTDEYWYSDDLRINMMEKHTDPRTGVL